ncbi:hypothetical protein GGF43_001467 [Coemansia sp. RSA 2618]|nr:hypothetical protein GGF43_001467 [Coemansia sp. RSA 2618]
MGIKSKQLPPKEERKAAKKARQAEKADAKIKIRQEKAARKKAKKETKAKAREDKKKEESSDSEDSDSEEEEKPEAAVEAVAAKEESSDSSDSSDSESEAEVETKAVAEKEESSDSDSSDSDSDSSSDKAEVEETKADSSSDSSDSSDSDSSDSDSDANMDEDEESDSGKRKADSDVEMEDTDESSSAKKQKTDAEPASLFVGNLPFTATVESMKDTFGEFGEIVDARIATDRETGRPKGFGYVDFASEEARDAAMASEYLEIEGRQLRMDKATPKANKREQGGGRDNKPTNDPSKTLFMGNMSFHSTEDSIREAFAECGNVVSVRIVTDRETGRPKGFGYIEFDSLEASASAMEWNGTDLDGRNIRLDYSAPRNNDGGNRGGRGGGRGGFRGGRGGGGRGGFRGGRGGGRFNSNY